MSDLPPADGRNHGEDTTETVTVEAVTCLACGCLCDDIGVTIRSGQIAAVRHACPIGDRWFSRDGLEPSDWPEAMIDGEPADADRAVALAASLLASSRCPVILGLDRSSNETVAAAVGLADRLGATIEVSGGEIATPRILAFQRAGRVSATLGEVKARADVVVFWRADPVTTHPRHLERYSATPSSRFLPEGRAARTLIVADTSRTATAEQADASITIDGDREFEVLWTLRALVRGMELGDDRIRSATNGEPAPLRMLASRLRSARYGAFFLGDVPGSSLATAAARVEAANRLVRDLNEQTRFVLLGMGGPGNRSGAEAVLSWQTGFPSSVDLGAGYPESLPGRTADAADVALIVGEQAATASRFPAAKRVVIAGPAGHDSTSPPTVWLSASLPGLVEAGTVTRTDGVSLPLRPVRRSRFPGEREWLERLIAAIGRGAGA